MRRRAAPLTTVVREWARIGITSFGGPPAQVALLRELCVERRRWIDAREFEDANAATQLLPGPGGTQLAVYCARRAGGPAGMLAGGLAFILPGLVILLAIAALALSESPPAWIRAVGAGGVAAVVAVVVQAGLALGRSSLEAHHGAARRRAAAYAVLGAAATVAVGPGVVLVLLGCGLAELAWRRRPGAAASVSPAALVLAVATLPALAWTAFKVGALSYGGGFVIIPLMQADAVDTYGWMTDAEFANAVAYGQLTPGPVVHTVAMVGWAAAGLGGALFASAIAFAPSFIVVAALGDRFVQIRRSPNARAFLDGAGPAAIGAILGAAVPLAQAIEEAWQWGVLAAAAVVLVAGRPALWALGGGAVAGVAAWLAGAPIP